MNAKLRHARGLSIEDDREFRNEESPPKEYLIHRTQARSCLHSTQSQSSSAFTSQVEQTAGLQRPSH